MRYSDVSRPESGEESGREILGASCNVYKLHKITTLFKTNKE